MAEPFRPTFIYITYLKIYFDLIKETFGNPRMKTEKSVKHYLFYLKLYRETKRVSEAKRKLSLVLNIQTFTDLKNLNLQYVRIND